MPRWVILAPKPVHLPTVRAEADLPGSSGGLGANGDLTADHLDMDAPDIEAVPLAPVASRHVELTGPRVKRTLLFTIRPGTPQASTARLEADLMAMPDHIATIRSWSLSRVDTARAPSRWTHVWEQEYTDVEGLTGAYLLHPYHWSHVDRWFDQELPTSVVLPRLAHVFRWSEGPVLTPDEETRRQGAPSDSNPQVLRRAAD
ncbi:Dabb family protein [Streptomyces sp. NPDC000410]|uniref:Dabb family protein n=1 Tax=Streptomyces sp. NPDC000410 TaxID=3154254 RepID=UPI003323A167